MFKPIRLPVVVLVSISGVSAPAAQAQDSARTATASVNGIQMHYETLGNGPPLVLLHGFSGCSQTWSPHATVLAKDYRVIVPDLRGHGALDQSGRGFYPPSVGPRRLRAPRSPGHHAIQGDGHQHGGHDAAAHGDAAPSAPGCTTPPAGPTLVSGVVVSDTLELVWTDNSAVEEGYEVWVIFGQGDPYHSGWWDYEWLVTVLPPNSTSYREWVGPPIPYTSLGYYVVARKDGGRSNPISISVW